MQETEGLIELLNHWIEFNKKRSDSSLKEFSKWLQTKVEDNQEDGKASLIEKKIQIGFLFGELSNFADLWGKLAFKVLPIRRFEDYGLLKAVEFEINPTKKNLAEHLVNEISTAFEIIKRLIRDGLLKEELDVNDKRIRRVKLTPLGRKVIKKADQQAAKVAEILVGNSTEKEIDFLIRKFSELNEFHQNLYKRDYQSIDDLL